MENALIVSKAEKGIEFFSELLKLSSVNRITASSSAEEARKLLVESETDFDLVLINAPLRDDSGEGFAGQIAAKGMSQVILVVKNERFDTAVSACEPEGVLVVSKPVGKTPFRSALTLAKAAHNRVRRFQAENRKLKQKIEDIRIADRAKWILVSHMGMSEQEAHRYIEKQAMDMRSTKRAVAEGILKTYEN